MSDLYLKHKNICLLKRFSFFVWVWGFFSDQNNQYLIIYDGVFLAKEKNFESAIHPFIKILSLLVVIESYTWKCTILHYSASPIYFWMNTETAYCEAWRLNVRFSLIMLFQEAKTSKSVCCWVALLLYVVKFIFTPMEELRETLEEEY